MKLILLPAVLFAVASSDDENPVDRILKAISDYKYMSVEAEGFVKAPKSDAVEFSIKSLHKAPDLTYIDFRATGGQVDFIARKGRKTLVWHPIEEDWIDPQLLGKGASGTRLQNPSNIFAILKKNRGNIVGASVSGGVEELTLKIDSAGVKELIRDTVNVDEIKWDLAATVLKVKIDVKTNIILSATCESALPVKNGVVQFEFRLKGVRLSNVPQEFVFKITEGKREKTVALTPAAKKELGITE